MNLTHNLLASSPNCEIVFSRIFPASRETVFRLWTEGRHVRNWICPDGFVLSDFESDLRPEGNYRFVISPNLGTDCTMKGIYKRIEFPETLVYTDAVEWDDDSFKEAIVSLHLEEFQGKTKFEMVALYETEEDKNIILDLGVEEGTSEMLDRFESYLLSTLS
ncbi:SRPBCC family protein [Leptospira idonii]|uniref:Activator of Hsp90 ATPase homologue 1/2-like C-terminal domain-containing protein n=1 Tax=Leptospira idonii TaxID=1193500 RepID=A0A4R9M2R9_9LEPT|nr:SRPBCC domain-containing protein [Leptospira idonii]TGN20037.1 hypothetical protein EHS15_04885 [Leptospira idonii]